MHFKIRFLPMFIACGILLLSSQNYGQQYYKWVDAKGITNYSSKPPLNGNRKNKKVETVSTYGNSSNYNNVPPQRSFQTNALIPDVQRNYYNNSQQSRSKYVPQRTPEQEQEREALLKAASTPYSGAKGLTQSQLRTLAILNGSNNVSEDHSYNSPRTPSSITNCDTAGCWDNNGGRYNKGANNTYFPSSGGTCQSTGGEMHCY